MTTNDTPRAPHPYVGMWVTADGFIRQELLPNGRYDEARGNRRSAYTGGYTVTGNHLDYVDDTGFTATGDIRDGVLFHEHLVLYREDDERAGNLTRTEIHPKVGATASGAERARVWR